MKPNRYTELLFTSFILWIGADLLSAERLFRAGLSVQIHFFNVEYGDQDVQGQAVVLRGEPLEVDLGLMNQHDGPRTAAEIDWLSRVSLTLRPGGMFERQPVAGTLSDVRSRRS